MSNEHWDWDCPGLVDTLKLSPEVPTMPKSRPPYSPEFRRQMVDLVLAGRDPDDLAREFEPTGQSIRAWVAKASQKEGRQGDAALALAAPERDELVRLRRENKQLRLERDILSNQHGSRSACGIETGSIYILGWR
jgi:transposase